MAIGYNLFVLSAEPDEEFINHLQKRRQNHE